MSLPQRPFGAGPWVSVLTLGTAALARPYAGGFPPNSDLARSLIEEAIGRYGVNLIDTAPSYGSEHLVGDVLARYPAVMVATKVTDRLVPSTEIDYSRRVLGRDRLDLLQIHNATTRDLGDSRIMDAVFTAKGLGHARLVGASVYTVQEAKAAIAAGFDVLQVPLNLLDQRLLGVLTEARQAGVAVLARSVWLRGALAGSVDVPELVSEAALRAKARLWASDRDFPTLALRFALGAAVASLVIGPRTSDELFQAVKAADAGPLPWWRLKLAAGCAWHDPLVDPRTWPAPSYIGDGAPTRVIRL